MAWKESQHIDRPASELAAIHSSKAIRKAKKVTKRESHAGSQGETGQGSQVRVVTRRAKKGDRKSIGGRDGGMHLISIAHIEGPGIFRKK